MECQRRCFKHWMTHTNRVLQVTNTPQQLGKVQVEVRDVVAQIPVPDTVICLAETVCVAGLWQRGLGVPTKAQSSWPCRPLPRLHGMLQDIQRSNARRASLLLQAESVGFADMSAQSGWVCHNRFGPVLKWRSRTAAAGNKIQGDQGSFGSIGQLEDQKSPFGRRFSRNRSYDNPRTYGFVGPYTGHT